MNARRSPSEARASNNGNRFALLVWSCWYLQIFTFPCYITPIPVISTILLVNGAEHVTLVFDKGNNSRDNLDAVADSPYHFIGSLVPTQHTELLDIPMRRFHSLEQEGYPGVRVYRTKKQVFGVERTVLVTYNDKLFTAQSKTLLREIGKRQAWLRELEHRLHSHRSGKMRGKRPTLESVTKKVNTWLEARHMDELFHVEISEDSGFPALSYRFDRRAWAKLQKTLLGKTILFTDNDDWSDSDIVRGYRCQHHVEDTFRRMKTPMHICLRPQHHWTDQKIEVHVFYCVIALMLCSLLRRELHRRGFDCSIPRILEQLAGIREVGVIYPPQSDTAAPILKMTCSAMSEQQRAMYDALELGRYRAP